MKRVIAVLSLVSLSVSVWSADDAWYGTWVQRSALPMTMTVEKSGEGAKFTYRMPPGANPNFVLSFDTKGDGKEVPVLIDGKPSGETMTVKRVDERHTTSAWKINGTPSGTSRSEMSADGRAIKVESDNAVAGPNGVVGQITQYWDKK